MKYTKAKFKLGYSVKILKSDIPFRNGYKPQFTDETFDFSAISDKNHQISRNLETFYEKEARKCSD